MSEETIPKEQISTTPPSKPSKANLKHQNKLLLMRDCLLYGKSLEESQKYFETRGQKLSKSNAILLKKEQKSVHYAKDWFSKEALYHIEEDHKLSVERIRMMEERLMSEFEQVASTSFYLYVNSDEEEQQVIKNKAHDANLLMRMIAQFQSLQETKTKMFNATPMVQELMEVHARQEEEFQTPETPMEKPPTAE